MESEENGCVSPGNSSCFANCGVGVKPSHSIGQDLGRLLGCGQQETIEGVLGPQSGHGSREDFGGCGRPVYPEISLSEEPHGAATCHHAFLPLLWVPVEPATQLTSDSHTLVSSGVWKKEGREKTSSTRPSPTRSGSGQGSSLEAAYLGTVALGLVRGDDHVGHDEEGVFLLQSGQRGESTAMSPSAEPSWVAEEAGRSFNRTLPLTAPACHAGHETDLVVSHSLSRGFIT